MTHDLCFVGGLQNSNNLIHPGRMGSRKDIRIDFEVLVKEQRTRHQDLDLLPPSLGKGG